jgi:hypothetical protein
MPMFVTANPHANGYYSAHCTHDECSDIPFVRHGNRRQTSSQNDDTKVGT